MIINKSTNKKCHCFIQPSLFEGTETETFDLFLIESNRKIFKLQTSNRSFKRYQLIKIQIDKYTRLNQ